jgi:hypothetical protein
VPFYLITAFGQRGRECHELKQETGFCKRDFVNYEKEVESKAANDNELGSL